MADSTPLNLQALDQTYPLEYDVCVIGTGPAGCTLARELSDTSLRVLLVESGGTQRHSAIDAFNQIQNIGRPRTLDQWRVRNRILGGTSHTWTGRCAPLDEIDFEARPWIPHSGWPFSHEKLLPYLDRSAPYLGLALGSGFSDERFWHLSGRTPPSHPPDPRLLLPFFWQSSRDDGEPRDFMRFGASLLQRLGSNVTLITHATAVQILTSSSGDSVTGIEIACQGRSPRRVHASTIVVSAGAIENARLLLCSDRIVSGGLGNRHDLVGRFLMDHPRDTVGFFPSMPRSLQKRFGNFRLTRSSSSNLFRHGLRLSPHIQREEGLVNCAVFLREVLSPDDPWTAFVHLRNSRQRRHHRYFQIARKPVHFVRGVHNYYLSRNPMPHHLSRLELVCMCEQVPDPSSRITLSDTRDPLGLRISRIDWRTHPVEARTVRRAAQLVSSYFQSLGHEAAVLDEWITAGQSFPDHSFLDVAHPMGSTRMSTDPRSGVVDPDCQVYGVHGLYVAGSSTFPTSGHCNPTQTIVALAIRLADTLKLRLLRPTPILHSTQARLHDVHASAV